MCVHPAQDQSYTPLEDRPPGPEAAPFARRLYDSGTPSSTNVIYRPGAADSPDRFFGLWQTPYADWDPKKRKRDAPVRPEMYHDPNTSQGRQWFIDTGRME